MTKNIGSLLLEHMVLTEAQLKQAVQMRMRAGGRLASICHALGFADEQVLARLLAQQLGIAFCVLSHSALPLSLLSQPILEAGMQDLILPVHRNAQELLVASAEPQSPALIRAARNRFGQPVRLLGALQSVLLETIEQATLQWTTHPAGYVIGSHCTIDEAALPDDGTLLVVEPA